MLLAFQYYRVCRTQDQDKLPAVLEVAKEVSITLEKSIEY